MAQTATTTSETETATQSPTTAKTSATSGGLDGDLESHHHYLSGGGTSSKRQQVDKQASDDQSLTRNGSFDNKSCNCNFRHRNTGLLSSRNQHAITCPLRIRLEQQQQQPIQQTSQQHASSSHKLCLRECSRPSSELSRTSLLGRPLKVETHYKDLRYRKKQNIIYNFLERPRGWKAALYHFVL